jgi:Zn finger protein HypA/HybF involved in hydrogenase expression
MKFRELRNFVTLYFTAFKEISFYISYLKKQTTVGIAIAITTVKATVRCDDRQQSTAKSQHTHLSLALAPNHCTARFQLLRGSFI